MMINMLYVALGGAIGSAARFALTSAIGRWLGMGFPYATLAVNVLGSLAMGALVGWLAQRTSADAMLRLLLAVGVLGGFTTFSAFSLDVATLFQRGEMTAALIYITASVVVSVAGLFIGLVVIRELI